LRWKKGSEESSIIGELILTMTFKEFTEPQKQALLDFVVLTTNGDDSFAGAKVEDVHRMLASMGYITASEE
jgi:hypothetical protein